MTLNRNDQFKSLLSLGSTYAGPDDLSCQAAVKWDKDNLYFYADVTDNIHFASSFQDSGASFCTVSESAVSVPAIEARFDGTMIFVALPSAAFSKASILLI